MIFHQRILHILCFTTLFMSTKSFQTPNLAICNQKYSFALQGYGGGRSSSRYTSSQDRSKRQERVGHLVRTELAQIIQQGFSIKHSDFLDDDLRRRINVVNVNVSPDLRQARITVSIIAPTAAKRRSGQVESDDDSEEDMNQIFKSDITVDQRRAYSWLVRSSKMIRHAMAQRLSHMKTVPDLTFVQADVGAAVDVMKLIDKVNEGHKRERIGTFGGNDDALPEGMFLDDDDFDEEDGWIDDDDDDDEWVDEE